MDYPLWAKGCMSNTTNISYTYMASGAMVMNTRALYAMLDAQEASADIELTLPIGTMGQMIYIVALDATTQGIVVTPESLIDATLKTSLTFDADGEYAVLVSDGTSWHVVASTATVA